MAPDACGVVARAGESTPTACPRPSSRNECRRPAAAAHRTRPACTVCSLATCSDRLRFIASIVQPRVGRVELRAAIDADQSPREVIVHGRRRSWRHDEREQAQLAGLVAIERVLTRCRRPSRLRCQAARTHREASRRPPAAAQNAGRSASTRAAWSRIRADNLRVSSINARISAYVDDEAEVAVVVMVKVTHRLTHLGDLDGRALTLRSLNEHWNRVLTTTSCWTPTRRRCIGAVEAVGPAVVNVHRGDSGAGSGRHLYTGRPRADKSPRRPRRGSRWR